MFQYSLFALVISALTATSAHAIPLRSPNAAVSSAAIAESLLFAPNSQTDYDFEGIVELSNCSGSLIRFEKSEDTDKALVMTNGHCIGGFDFLQPGEVRVNEPSSRRFTLLKTINDGAPIRAEMLLYATMTNTDMSIYRLTETYKQIEERHKIRAFTLSSAHPEVDQEMEVVSGYWKRGYSCKIEAFIFELQEGYWMFKDSIRYSRPGCEVIGGTSGSPIVLKGTREVIGINNTGNESGERCTQNNPCEINDKGDVFFQKGYSYGQQTYQIYTCLNDKNEIDLKKEGCQLPQ